MVMAGNIRMLSNNTNMRHSTGSSSACTTAPGTTGVTSSGLKKPRRLWTLHDRSAVSVNLLKANLAQDGCEEAQLNVAKKLLNDTSDDSAAVLNENARLAIYWLIKSSEQGNEEATELLKSCMESGKGINCQNIIDVQMCIDTPRNDKLTVKAAKLLYEKLNNGEDFITTTQLESRLSQVRESRTVSFSTTHHSSTPADSVSSSAPGATVSTTSSKPPIDQLEQDFDETNNLLLQPHAFESLDKKQKLQNIKELLAGRFQPSTSGVHQGGESESPYKNYRRRHGFKLTEEDMIKNATMYNIGEVPPILLSQANVLFSGQFQLWHFKSYASISFLQFVILILMWSSATVTPHSILSVAALMIGTWSSYNLFGWNWNERRFSDWTTLYQNVLREENWSQVLPTTRFYTNNRKPYLLSGLICALTFMFCNATAQDKISPYPWLQFTFGSLTILVLLFAFNFNQRPSWEFASLLAIQIIPIIIRVLHIPSSPFLSEYVEYIQTTGYGFIAEYFPELEPILEKQLEYLNVENVRRMLQIFLFSKLVLNAIGRTKLNHGKTLSEVLLYLWVYQFVQWSRFLAVGPNIWFVACCYILLGVTLLILASLTSINIWKFFTGIFICFVIILTLLISMSLVFPQDITGVTFKLPLLEAISNSEETPPTLTWKEYDATCHQSAWRLQNLGYTQLSCPLKFKNRQIEWKGKITLVHILDHEKSESKNMMFEVLLNIENEDSTAAVAGSWKNFLPFRFGQDSENYHPIISLLIPVTHAEDYRLKLIQHLLSLRSGDEIAFIGKLGNNIGGIVPEVTEVEKFWCVRCQMAEYGEIILIEHSDTLENMKHGYAYMEGLLINSTTAAFNYTRNLFEQIQIQFNLSETVSAIADE